MTHGFKNHRPITLPTSTLTILLKALLDGYSNKAYIPPYAVTVITAVLKKDENESFSGILKIISDTHI